MFGGSPVSDVGPRQWRTETDHREYCGVPPVESPSLSPDTLCLVAEREISGVNSVTII